VGVSFLCDRKFLGKVRLHRIKLTQRGSRVLKNSWPLLDLVLGRNRGWGQSLLCRWLLLVGRRTVCWKEGILDWVDTSWMVVIKNHAIVLFLMGRKLSGKNQFTGLMTSCNRMARCGLASLLIVWGFLVGGLRWKLFWSLIHNAANAKFKWKLSHLFLTYT